MERDYHKNSFIHFSSLAKYLKCSRPMPKTPRWEWVCCQRRGEYNPRHWVLQFVVHDGCWVTTFSKIFQFFIVGHVHNSFLMALHNLLEPPLVVYDGGFFPVSAVSFLFEIELHTSFTFSSFLIVPIDCKW